MRIYLSALTLFLTACSGGADGDAPVITEVLPRKAHNHTETRLVLRGKGLAVPAEEAGKRAKKLRVLLWAGTKERLVRSISLFDVRATSDTALSARLGPGTYPGDYRVVLQTGKQTVFTDARLTIVALDHETGPPRVIKVQGKVFSDVPGRVYLLGENLRTAREVSLRNQQGKEVTKLTRLRLYNTARLGGSLAGGLVPPGTYHLAVTNRFGVGAGTKIQIIRSGYDEEATLSFGVYFGVLGTVFVIGCTLAGLQGDLNLRQRRGRRNLFLLLSGFIFTFLLLGSVQFVLSWWS